MPSPRTRQHNVTAAQWSANGAAMGLSDLTAPGADIFGENVFSLDEQRQRLPKHVFKQLTKTLATGGGLDPPPPHPPAQAMKEGALEKGAPPHTHRVQPLPRTTPRKHHP